MSASLAARSTSINPIDHYLPPLSESARRWLRFGLVVLGILAAWWLIQRLNTVLTPIAVSLALAYILNPFVSLLEGRGVSRMRSTIWIFAIGFAALTVLVVLAATTGVAQTAQLLSNLDVYRDAIHRWFLSTFPTLMDKAPQSGDVGQLLKEHGGAAAAMVASYLSMVAAGVSRWMVAAVLVPMYTFFFLLHFNDMIRAVRDHLPDRYRETIVRLVSVTDQSMADFYRGRLLISLAVGALTAIGWLIVGVPYSVPLGLAAGVLNLVPVMAILALPPALIATYFSAAAAGESWLWPVILVLVVYFVVQAIDNFILSPYITGQTSGLHPITTVVALLVGAELAGILGMLVAIPITCTLRYVFVQHILPEIRRLAAPRAVVAAVPSPENPIP
ncbi:MAG: AI-2E family transporter [Planctomycetia bacterium]|nr:MAG: AI-2E family transporter [Planctomycetia bacterium]